LVAPQAIGPVQRTARRNGLLACQIGNAGSSCRNAIQAAARPAGHRDPAEPGWSSAAGDRHAHRPDSARRIARWSLSRGHSSSGGAPCPQPPRRSGSALRARLD